MSIRAALAAAAFSPLRLARKHGLDGSHLRRCLSGASTFSPAEVAALTTELGQPVTEVLDEGSIERVFR